MSHGQNLRDLLAPLGVYRWEGTFQWGELQSEGAALDQVAQDLAHTQREMNLYTAQEEGLTDLLTLLGRGGDRGGPGGAAPNSSCPAAHWGRQLYPRGHERHPAGVWNFRQSGGDGDAA